MSNPDYLPVGPQKIKNEIIPFNFKNTMKINFAIWACVLFTIFVILGD